MTSGCDERAWLDDVVIAQMAECDLDEVLAIERESFPSAWSRESYERELRNRNSHYFTARYGRRLIGYFGMWVVVDEAHITTLAVHPQWRRKGLGGRLLNAVTDVAQRQGVSRVTLEVRERNEAAIAMYRKFGFQVKGILPGYYGDTKENGVVMCKVLPKHGAVERQQ